MSLLRLLRIFGDAGSTIKAKAVHGKVISYGFAPAVYTNNHLVAMYVKLDDMESAHHVFDQMPERNLVSWTILVTGYARIGLDKEALGFFRSMVAEGFEPNYFTYVGAISACVGIGEVRPGKEIHGRIYRVQKELNVFVSNSLVNFYAKCGIIKSAQIVFDGILHPNLVSWASILTGYCQCGDCEEALRILLRARRAGEKVNEYVCASVLGACADLADLTVGKQVHCHVIKCGIGSDRFVATGIIDLYAKCGNLVWAQQAFWELDEPHLVNWTALIGGYAQKGQGEKAINFFCKLHSSGLKPSEHTLSSVLTAFADTFSIKGGKQLHSLILKLGYELMAFVGNAVLDLYAKCGLLEESLRVFEEMMDRDVVTWNALISGHVRQGHFEEAIKLLDQMLYEGVRPSLYTYSNILSLCGDLPSTEWGKQTHSRIIKPGYDTNVVVGSALVDMYAKCGRLSDARIVFDNLKFKNLVSWNTMVVGYAQHGFGKEALEIFDKMQRDGIKPNDITFLGVLSACGRIGRIEDGWCYFNSMVRDHGIIPRIDHFACVVDLFARGGQIRRASEFITSMPIEPDKVVWRSLLAGCITHKDLDLGRYAAECILRIDPYDISAYIMLSSVYADAGMWAEMAEVRKVMKEKGLKKNPGCSWIEVTNKVHSFIVGDKAHRHKDSIHETVDRLTLQMLDAGYAPDAISSLQNIEL